MRKSFEKRRRNLDNLKPLNQFGHLPRKQKKRLSKAHKADMARRKGFSKLKSDIKMVRYYLRVESNIRRVPRLA